MGEPRKVRGRAVQSPAEAAPGAGAQVDDVARRVVEVVQVDPEDRRRRARCAACSVRVERGVRLTVALPRPTKTKGNPAVRRVLVLCCGCQRAIADDAPRAVG